MKKALDGNSTSYVILMDVLTCLIRPESLPLMIDLLKTKAVVIGSRYMEGGGAPGWDFRRHFLSFSANL